MKLIWDWTRSGDANTFGNLKIAKNQAKSDFLDGERTAAKSAVPEKSAAASVQKVRAAPLESARVGPAHRARDRLAHDLRKQKPGASQAPGGCDYSAGAATALGVAKPGEVRAG